MKKKFTHVFFDLDGTLTDPFEGITRSVEYALEKFGIAVSDRRGLAKFIGPPLLNSFKDFYGFSQADAERCIEYYRERFSTVGWQENVVYDGIPETLETLRSRGKKLFIATSKPEIFAVRIAGKFGLSQFFDGIFGASLDSKRVEKADVLGYALEKCGASACSSIIVGDRRFDIEGGHAVGMKAMGVLYGYGDESEHKNAGADYIARTPHEIADMFFNA